MLASDNERNPKLISITTKDGDSSVAMPRFVSQQYYDDAAEFQFDQNDVIIVSYPKSGTTWTVSIIRLIGGMDIEQVKREDKVDTRSAIKRIANFLGENYAARVSDPVTMETILEKCSFREMSQKMDQFSTVIKDGKCPVVRRGVVGDWKSLMTKEQAEIIDRMTAEHGLQHYWEKYADIV
ncbi:uncharacterized protein LOC144749840 [Ciona intestinalis]